jgi:hypothetical protein
LVEEAGGPGENHQKKCKLKDRHYNGQKKTDKRTKNVYKILQRRTDITMAKR